MSFPLSIPSPLAAALAGRPRVLLALSGGVDSAVALAVLQHAGCAVTAVTFKNFCYGETADPAGRACCSLEAVDEARRLAARLGADHHVSDVSEAFRSRVIEPFVSEYATGRTPNPCVECNAAVRFPQLLRLARLGGHDLIATGHYARTLGTSAGAGATAGAPALLRGLDPDKDQSYFLYRLAPELLRRTVFPLGWFTKGEVRAAARALQLPMADKPESQEICFVPDGDRSFLFPDPVVHVPGEIVDGRGRVLGRHRGLVHYTVGQRRGLGVAAPRPLYVLELDPEGNRLVVGSREDLARTRIVCDAVVGTGSALAGSGPPAPWSGSAAEERAAGEGEVLARIRHGQRGLPVGGWRWCDGTLVVELAEPAHGVAPGQALVLHTAREGRILGGGRIVAADGGPAEQEAAPAGIARTEGRANPGRSREVDNDA
ncbi:MAG: tRNA 2-thiouridine(34) synthase MnmA [Candidatus Krumholzibacteriia bacterium]